MYSSTIMPRASQVKAYLPARVGNLATGLADLGLPVFGGPENPERAHIVAVGHDLSDQHDAVSDAPMLSLHQHFEAAQVRHTIRRGMLRFSFHYYNNNDDVSRIIAAARQWTAKMGQWSAGSKAVHARP